MTHTTNILTTQQGTEMKPSKIYGPWIKWHGDACPVLPDTKVKVKFRNGTIEPIRAAGAYSWIHMYRDGDIVEYHTVTELEAAEKLLLANGYTIIPPAKPLTFEDAVPMTEAPPVGTEYWVISAGGRDGVYSVPFANDEFDHRIIKRRMAYLDKEHALIAAKHIFGLKGGEL